jgi:phosphate transport system protein
MTKLDAELSTIKEETVEMWKLVESQLQKGLSALLNFDMDLAREIVFI